MKKIKFIIQLIMFFFILFLGNKVLAASGNLSGNKTSVDIGEEFNISLNLSGASLASMDVKVNIDTSKVEYVSSSEPNNTNFSNGRILYSWVDTTGGSNPKGNGTVVTFRLRTKNSGTANFSASGTFYDIDENSVGISLSGASITIKENIPQEPEEPEPTEPDIPDEPDNPEPPEDNNPPSEPNNNEGPNIPNEGDPNINPEPNDDNSEIHNSELIDNTPNQDNANLSSNANLKSLQIDVEGISPSFNTNITQYYIVVDNSVNNINVNAIPEDENATVNVSGNKEINTGTNLITITVTAENKSTQKKYIINVSKAIDPDSVNTNLENLAIQDVILNPEFSADILEYTATVGSNIESLNILAVPQVEGANVVITGGKSLSFGENIITINVTGKNGTSSKIYTVNVYRKNENEEQQNILLQENNVNNINTIDNQIQSKNEMQKLKDRRSKTILIILFWIVLIIIISIIVFKVIRKNK